MVHEALRKAILGRPGGRVLRDCFGSSGVARATTDLGGEPETHRRREVMSHAETCCSHLGLNSGVKALKLGSAGIGSPRKAWANNKRAWSGSDVRQLLMSGILQGVKALAGSCSIGFMKPGESQRAWSRAARKPSEPCSVPVAKHRKSSAAKAAKMVKNHEGGAVGSGNTTNTTERSGRRAGRCRMQGEHRTNPRRGRKQ